MTTFYWYDLETSGTAARWDRITQFAGLRTDAELNETGAADAFHVQLPDDVLPNPDAALVTGLTPQALRERGITEWAALRRINALFSVPGTCTVGFNTLRFDDEFVRHGLYRNLMDPYAREFRNGNSRWDIMDLVRATGALRREGMEWPVDQDGLPVYRLEELTRANDIEHGQAHDALSDVRATLALARRLRAAQPRLFEYYLTLRDKSRVRALLEPPGSQLCVHVSAMYPRARRGLAPVVSIGRHPTNSNVMIVADVSQDIDALLEWPEDRIRAELYRPDNPSRPPLKEIRINRCPFIATADVLGDEHWALLGSSRREAAERQRRLRRADVAQKILRVFAPRPHAPAEDVEAQLYEAFLQDADRGRAETLQQALDEGCWADLDFRDRRLPALAARLKARCFPNLLDEGERTDWQAFVHDKLSAAGPWLGIERYRARVDDLMNERALMGARDAEVLNALRTHGADVAARYGLAP
ncbi:MAG: exodeoxyribonuclease I [Pseudomonadales bacterium]